MNAGQTEPRWRVRRGLALAACLFGCDRQPLDPPPPPARHEVVAAPPGALGAHAAGREAAPSVASLGEPPQVPEAAPGVPEGVPDPTPELEPPADAGIAAPQRPSEGVAL